ncbi:MAG: bifunctional (p)ppGpp synthetase/guanosine-3',5'-bis(diphosphate) 3'-pyrophosphohydrolase [Bacteroidaceae bacterium]|nr:bifunctional (p)ppGpp synthetase/guanosine-3',5'-bis(diphosphate) 3'-pyrophosphohydrolase [Bacteroidaceae bacterium]
MKTEEDYVEMINQKIDEFWKVENVQSFSETDKERIRAAYELAREAHSSQKRKTGEPYIIHPIAVATIVAKDFELGVNPIIAAFLHDVVEDTRYSIDDIKEKFGSDVAFLVGTVTKEKKKTYEMSKQIDNFKQMLDSIHYDIRALLVKLADRLNNMRTLSSMPPDKQMKIAGETDYFYAPLANRLGLYGVKSELENLSMKYRCPHEYSEMEQKMEKYRKERDAELNEWTDKLRNYLNENGIVTDVYVKYRSVYSIWRKMMSSGNDFRHIRNKHVIQIVFSDYGGLTEKNRCLEIYSILTDCCKELPASIHNYIDSPKENGYQSFHLRILDVHGEWEEVHISSDRMIYNSKMGCISERTAGVKRWIDKFKDVLQDIAYHSGEGGFIEKVVSNFYYDDILVFTPEGTGVVLPKEATALDFAYEIHTNIGNHAQYARINGKLCSVKTKLHRGDSIEIGMKATVHPRPDWLDHVITYKARRSISTYLNKEKTEGGDVNGNLVRCMVCHPLPGDEVIGFKSDDGKVSVHKRNCSEAVRLASERGDNILNVEFLESRNLYPVTINVIAIDRYHLLIDLVNVIAEDLKLNIDSLHTVTTDELVDCTINFNVHSVQELDKVITHINEIYGVDEVKKIEK